MLGKIIMENESSNINCNNVDSVPPKRRKYFRVQYPLGQRPKLILNKDDEYAVVDISEHGVRFAHSKSVTFLPYQFFKGKIIFDEKMDDVEEIEGKILYSLEEASVIFLSKPLTGKRLVREQYRLRKKVGYV